MQYGVAELDRALDELASVDVEAFAASEAVVLLRELVPVKRRLESFCSSLSARAVGGDLHLGSKNAAEFVAGLTGVSEREAARSLAAQRRLDCLPEVKNAVASGSLSGEQADAIARGSDGDSNIARELLSGAPGSRVEDIQSEARRKARERAASEEEYHEKLRRKRSLSSWKDADGLMG